MRGKYANIIVDISHEKVDRPFQYRIPPHLQGKLEEGMAVTIPFGKGNKELAGYVMEVTDQAEYAEDKLKDILDIRVGDMPVEADFIRLAAWMKRNYGSTMITALKTVLPVRQKKKTQEKRTVTLKLPVEEAKEQLAFYEKKHQTARARLLKELIGQQELSYELITGKLHVTTKTIQALAEAGICQIRTESFYRDPVRLEKQETLRKRLSAVQQDIVEKISADLQAKKPGVHLIHGITGSGKTEVYLALIERVLKNGKQAIVLIPEIALTYQTLIRFFNRFPGRVSVMNSRLSAGEKYDQFERAKSGEIDVMIGPRSALFTPFPKLGLIIIDEEHENSYKSESMPKYHARETAVQIASCHAAGVVLGSATPSLESYYRAKNGEYFLYEMKERLTGGCLPTVYTVDLRQELKEGNRSIFSRKLQELLTERLNRGEQSILFLNRRGYAGFISCRSCGYVMKCPHCDVSLSEHRNGTLVCHYCGYEQPKVSVCPQCGSKYILGFRAGTEQIEEQVKKMYPKARVLRMDADTTRSKDGYEQILSAFANREADVLIGTQMIVKGHDFPDVTLVGILAADLSLSVGDYRASERTFELLTQAAGRAGRGNKPGEVVIQTYQPEHYSVQYAAKQDYEGFYEEEILYREMMQYPPAAHMLAIQIAALAEEGGRGLAERLAEAIRKSQDGSVRVIGPAPAAIGKINDIYRFVIYIKHREYDRLVEIKDFTEELLNGIENRKETVYFDFDPVNAY
ncbi:MAG: primosomal protein N' [Lachnospiraceae bacterium]|nr:primosomal protein N' [Lachnospiraceae bacterium]